MAALLEATVMELPHQGAAADHGHLAGDRIADLLAIAVSARHWLKEDLHAHARTVSRSLATGIVLHLARDDVWEAYEAVRAVASAEGGAQRCDVVVLDRARRVFASSDPARFPLL